MSSKTDGSGIVGQEGLNSSASEFNSIEFQIEQAFGKIATTRLVKVMGVESAGELAPVGFVDVKPMVNLVNGLLGDSMQHGIIYGVPYFRLQGGKNAIIMDPVVGDIGFVVVADRDSSIVKQTKEFGNPGSDRRFSLSDGIYIGGVLNDTPEQYVQFNSAGVTIADKNGNKIEMKTGGIFLTCSALVVNGNIQMSGSLQDVGGGVYTGTLYCADIVVNSVSFNNHVHNYIRPNTGGVLTTTGGPHL